MGGTGEVLTGRRAYLDILAPADDVYPQTENEKALKNVIHRLSDAHEILLAENHAQADEIERQKRLVLEHRTTIENWETEERVRRREHLEEVTTVYLEEVKKQKQHNDELIEKLREQGEELRARTQDVSNRDNIIESRLTEIKEKEQRIAELLRDVAQLEDVVAQTREERDETKEVVGKKSQEVEALEGDVRQKESELRAKDEEEAELRKRANENARRAEDVETTNKELEYVFKRERARGRKSNKRARGEWWWWWWWGGGGVSFFYRFIFFRCSDTFTFITRITGWQSTRRRTVRR